MFCRCPNRFGAAPNTLVCPVCLGYPGTLPVPNRQAVDLAVRLALALGCEVRETSVFARKNYFYPDLPKGYQISQFDRPLAEDGALPLSRSRDKQRAHRAPPHGGGRRQAPARGAGRRRAAGPEPGRLQPLRRAAGRDRLAARHGERRRGAGLPPDPPPAPALHRRPATATWRRGACAATPTSRCAAAARPGSAPRPRSRTSTPSATSRRAIEHEIERQIALIESGGRVAQETRSFDADHRHDAADAQQGGGARLPLLPGAGPAAAGGDAGADGGDPRRPPRAPLAAAGAARGAVRPAGRRRPGAHRLARAGRLLRGRGRRRCPPIPRGSPTGCRARCCATSRSARWSSAARSPPSASPPWSRWWTPGRSRTAPPRRSSRRWRRPASDPAAAVERLGLAQVSDSSQIERWIDEVIEQNPAQVAQYRAGKVADRGLPGGPGHEAVGRPRRAEDRAAAHARRRWSGSRSRVRRSRLPASP